MQLLDRTFDVSITPTATVQLPHDTLRALESYLFQEARLLDDWRLDEWLALWDEDGRYWIPRFEAQADPFESISLFWEDKMLRETRVRRINNPRNWSQQPRTRSSHLVGNITVEGVDAEGHLIVRSNVVFTEFRSEQRPLAGTVHHKLRAVEGGGWRIRMKRIDLVNCESVFGNLEVFI